MTSDIKKKNDHSKGDQTEPSTMFPEFIPYSDQSNDEISTFLDELELFDQDEQTYDLPDLNALDDLLGLNEHSIHENMPSTSNELKSLLTINKMGKSDIPQESELAQKTFQPLKLLNLQEVCGSQNLTKPLYCPCQNVLVVGTEHPFSLTGIRRTIGPPTLSTFACDLLELGKNDKFRHLSNVRLEAHIRDMEWLTQGKSVFHAGDRGFHVFSIDQMRNFRVRTQAQTQIRQATLDSDSARFLAGGHNGTVSLYQFGGYEYDATLEYYRNVGGTVSSINWNRHNPNLCSWTLEDNQFEIWDTRLRRIAQKLSSQALSENALLNPQKLRLYAHNYMTQAQVKLGFQMITDTGSCGLYVLYDLRMLSHGNIWPWKDGTLTAVGEIIPSMSGKRNACFGLGGFSVWKSHNFTPRGLLASYKSLNVDEPLKTSGAFIDSNNLAVTDSLGRLAVYDLNQSE